MPQQRLAALDLARGLAVIAMAVYHFSWDLSWFALVDWPVANGQGWRGFAALIAGSFLFFSGVSLDLSHHRAIRWRAFAIRLAKIALAAAAVSLATYFAFGNNFVRFGILHCIAASSLMALPFLRLPLPVVAGVAIAILTLPLWASSFVFNGQAWLWTGLGTPNFGSVDYVPLAPWAGVTLMGLVVSKAFRELEIWARISRARFAGPLGSFTRLLGRHSLPIYLLHQPLLYGLVWAFVQLGPANDQAETAFVRSCAKTCQDNLGAPGICEAVCGCTLRFLKADAIWIPLNENPSDQSLLAGMNQRYTQCLTDPEQIPVN